jgi:hypothetical protein
VLVALVVTVKVLRSDAPAAQAAKPALSEA